MMWLAISSGFILFISSPVWLKDGLPVHSGSKFTSEEELEKTGLFADAKVFPNKVIVGTLFKLDRWFKAPSQPKWSRDFDIT